MNTENTSLPPETTTEVKGWLGKNKVWVVLIVALVLSNVGVYFYQSYYLGKLQDEFVEAFQEQHNQAAELMRYRNSRDAASIGKALTLATSAEMMAGRKSNLDLFLIEMVQETDVELVSVVDTAGMVYLSTNKKYENQHVLDVFPSVPGKVESPTLIEVKSNEVLFAAPILMDRKNLGTFVMTFKTDSKTDVMLNKIGKQELVKSE